MMMKQIEKPGTTDDRRRLVALRIQIACFEAEQRELLRRLCAGEDIRWYRP